MFELLIKILTNSVDTLIKQGLTDAANRKKRAARELYSVYQLLRRYSLALERVSKNLNPAYSPTWIARYVEEYITEITEMMRELFLFFGDPRFSSLKVGNPEAREFFHDVVSGSRYRLKKIWEKKGFDPAKLEIWDRDLFDLLNLVAGDDIDIWFYLNAIS